MTSLDQRVALPKHLLRFSQFSQTSPRSSQRGIPKRSKSTQIISRRNVQRSVETIAMRIGGRSVGISNSPVSNTVRKSEMNDTDVLNVGEYRSSVSHAIRLRISDRSDAGSSPSFQCPPCSNPKPVKPNQTSNLGCKQRHSPDTPILHETSLPLLQGHEWATLNFIPCYTYPDVWYV